MVEDTSKTDSTGNETPASSEKSSESEETKNSSNNQLFDKGFGVGKEKGQKELLKQLGVNGVDEIQGILQAHKEQEEATKSTEQKLADLKTSYEDMKSKHTEVETKLESYVTRDRAKAQKLYDSLPAEDKQAFDAMEVDLEKAMPVLERFSSKPTKRKVGNPVSPSPDNVDNGPGTQSINQMMEAIQKGGVTAIQDLAKDIADNE